MPLLITNAALVIIETNAALVIIETNAALVIIGRVNIEVAALSSPLILKLR